MEFFNMSYPLFFLILFLVVAFYELIPKKLRILKRSNQEKQLLNKIDLLETELKLQKYKIKKLRSENLLNKFFARNIKKKFKSVQSVTTSSPSLFPFINKSLFKKIDHFKHKLEEKNKSLKGLEHKVVQNEDIATQYLTQIHHLQNRGHNNTTVEIGFAWRRKEEAVVTPTKPIHKQKNLGHYGYNNLEEKQRDNQTQTPFSPIRLQIKNFRQNIEQIKNDNKQLATLNQKLIQENFRLKKVNSIGEQSNTPQLYP